MEIIDLRSDTFTLPTDEMYASIHNCELGDDVFNEDSTVNKLQEQSAKLMGTESALLVPSGTMANLVSILTHCERGSEIILGDKSHTFIYEAGGISSYGGIHSRQLSNQDDGLISIQDIKSAIRSDDVHFPKTKLISLENTHNICYGTPLPIDYINEVKSIALENNLKLHIDGARIFNASVALNINVKEFGKLADSITFCLSKGLSAPIGSMICGSEKFIHKARYIRKSLGGGMRQAGIIAASGLIAINQMIPRLKNDHDNAKLLADSLSKFDSIAIDTNKVKTNIIYFKLLDNKFDANSFLNKMLNQNIKFLHIGNNKFRIVTHCRIKTKHIEHTIDAFNALLN